ncbi:HAD family hydrolase [Planctobacterium marinum]|uniref:HAD family hydrolase n=1 Tax=Planctobacterium marinum TaxID=1631968 RepID=UPI001E2E6F97|nr:HAD-IA family hydrolase [Planctobacterium marinum]MCC2604138.1 HAD-IA family hydrolase [Planctobacterium marinum]
MLDKYKVVIFDWDGTVMDSIAHIVHCVQQAAIDNRLAVPDEASVRNIIGLSLPEAFLTLFGEDKSADFERFRDNYKDQYVKNDDITPPLFAHVPELLTGLLEKGIKLAVATGKGRRGLDNAILRSGLGHFFSYSRTSDEAASKPSPDMLIQISRFYGVSAAECLMVGDSIHDMKMAKNANMDSIGVTFGAHQRERLLEAQPTAIIDCYSTAIGWLN